MNFKEIFTYIKKPELFSKGTHFMWSDPHMSRQLQEVHLNPELDLASRKPESIDRTISWMLEQQPGSKDSLNILELGCGPGLYTQRLAAMGHRVTGVDISGQSLQTARERAETRKLDIRYIQGSYLEWEPEESAYDMVYIIYCDFGVLDPEEQKVFLASVFRALKPGGRFFFDVLRDIRREEKRGTRNWEEAEEGFWSPEPYIVLHDSIPFPEAKAFLEQHVVLTEGETRCYRFWQRFYNEEDLLKLLDSAGFINLSFDTSVLPEDGLWNGDNVLFCHAEKS